MPTTEETDMARVDIYVHHAGGSDGTQTSTVKNTAAKGSPAKMNTQAKKTITKEATAATFAVNSAKAAAKEVVNFADYMFQRHMKLNDDYIGQRNYTAAKNIVGRIGSVGTAIASGFATAGPVGAVIAGALSVAAIGVDIAENYIQQNDNIQKMELNLSFNRMRSGYSLTSGSIGEDR